MATPYLFTYHDVTDHLSDWAGFTSSTPTDTLRKIKRAVENAYRALTNLRNWTYYYYRGRINTNASYDTGTIAYTNSTRTVTLTSGTFPSYSNISMFRIGPVDYQVVANPSTTTLTLSVNSNPNEDVASGTSYTLYQDSYALPVNFKSMGTVRDANRSKVLQYIEPNEFIASRNIWQVPTIPFWYTIRSDPSYMGTMAISFYPPPNDFYQYDYMGLRYPRSFTQILPYTTGTVTTSGTTLTGTGTTFTSNMAGCVIRFSGSTTAPTGTTGTNPYQSQRIISSFGSATSLTLDTALTSDVTGVAFEISDPIDMEAGAMYTAFLRLCELELGQMMNRGDIQRLEQQYGAALRLAMESDSRSFDEKPGGIRYWQRVSDYSPLSDATS